MHGRAWRLTKALHPGSLLRAPIRVAKDRQGIVILDDSHLEWQQSLRLACIAQHASLSEVAICPECP